MKIHQSVRHFAAQRALELPVVGDAVHDRLVDLHVDVFGGRAAEDRRAEREDHLYALFDATTDMYLAALQEGYSEAEAREMTHVVANFDFYNHGWTEMMEFPIEEIDDHYDRYERFFDRRGVTVDDPLGEFGPADGLPSAPATPEKLDDPEYGFAEGGYADDVYVETEDGEVQRGGADKPDDVDPADAPGA